MLHYSLCQDVSLYAVARLDYTDIKFSFKQYKCAMLAANGADTTVVLSCFYMNYDLSATNFWARFPQRTKSQITLWEAT